jgi:hypothetical protein
MSDEPFKLFRRHGETPFRVPSGAQVPLVSAADENVVPVNDGGVGVFILSDAADLAKYSALVDRVAKQEAVLLREEVVWSEQKQAYVVYARYVYMYQEVLGDSNDNAQASF